MRFRVFTHAKPVLILLVIILSACDTIRPPGIPTRTVTPGAVYVTETQTPLRECMGSGCSVVTVVPSGVSLPILARHESSATFWLAVEYQSQQVYVGPFIQVSLTYSSPPGAARTCPSRDCPQRFSIPVDSYILSLDIVISNLVEHWTQTVYEGEAVFLGPWIPPPSNSVWENTVIPASETARALSTSLPAVTVSPGPTTAPS